MSTSFVEFAIEDASLRDHFKFDCKWSVAGQYLAVSTYSKDQGGSLTIVSESGTVLEADQLVQKLSAFKVDSKINAFEWHPKLAVVACFWDNQVLGCFSVQPNQQRWIYSENESNRTEETKATEETVGPKSRIKSAILNHFKVISMLWLNDGEELFTVSSNGELQVHEYRMSTNHMILRHKEKLNESVADAVVWHATRESFVYIGYRSGVVCRWGSIQRQPLEVIQLENGIRKLLLSRCQLRLVVITDQLQLCQFSLAGDEVAEISKIKLPALGRIGGSTNPSRSPASDRLQPSRTSRDLSAMLIDEPNGILALCVFGERLVRLFQLDSGQNLAVLVVESVDFHWAGVSALAFCVEQQLLVAGTSNNHVVIWQREYETPSSTTTKNRDSIDPDQVQFVKIGELKIKGAVHSLTISAQSKIAFTSSQHELSFVEKQILRSVFKQTLIAIQTAAKQIRCIRVPSMVERVCNVECQVKDIHIGSDTTFWAFRSNFPKNVHVYECTSDLQLQHCVAFSIPSASYAIYRDCLWYLSQSGSASAGELVAGSVSLHCIRLKGSQDEHIHPISFKELTSHNSGISPVAFELNGDRLLMLFKLQGLARYMYLVYDVRQRQSAQLLHGPISLEPDQQLISAAISCDGAIIAFRGVDQLWLLPVEAHRPLQPVTNLSLSNESQMYFAVDESRLLVIQSSAKNVYVILCWLRTTNDSIRTHYRLYEHKQLDSDASLLGIQLPYIYMLRNEPDSSGSSIGTLYAHVLTEFNGVGSQTISVMLDFLTAGQADLNAMIRKIARSGEQDEQLWMNLARIAVKSGNVRMGRYCAARLGWSFVVRQVQNELKGVAIELDNSDEDDDEAPDWFDDQFPEDDDDEDPWKESARDPDSGATWSQHRNEAAEEEEAFGSSNSDAAERVNSNRSRECAALAVLASNLGLYDEAEALLRKSGQSGKLVDFFTGRNQWDQAVQVSERLTRRSVSYERARYLEEEAEDVPAAIEAYERAGCAASEVPRLLFDLGDIERLKQYCLKASTDFPIAENDESRPVAWSEVFSEGWWDEREQLVRWWAQYSESVGDLDEALTAYRMASDHANQVRLMCLAGDIKQAQTLLSDHEANAVERSLHLSRLVVNDVETTDEFDDMLITEPDETFISSRIERRQRKQADAELQRKDAALLYLARQLEPIAPDEAVSSFLACGAIEHAIRVCRQQSMTAQLIKIVASHGSQTEVHELIKQLQSQIGSDSNAFELGRFEINGSGDTGPDSSAFDRQQLFEQLMQLHYRVGELDLCIRFGLHGRLFRHVRALLQSEIERLDEQTADSSRDQRTKKEDSIGSGQKSREVDGLNISNETLDVALKLLPQNEQLIDLVVDLLLLRGEHAELIRDLIVEYRVRLDEQFLKKVNRVMGLNRCGASQKKSRSLLQSLADCSLQQGEYLVAAKLFNAVEDRSNAARALARAGDTEKLITYARIARDATVYRVAANYLQTLDSVADRESVIKEFYRKAGAKQELERYLTQNKS